MFGFLIGAACGILQLYLLAKVVNAVQAGKSGLMLLLLFLKLVVLGCAFAPVILFFRSELLWCAIGITAALVCGGGIIFYKRTNSKGDKNS